ncbi:MAG TPA: hypothetical protein VFN67_22720 [Polyangiales bacterium]|nr:hypothetical protein [Polyangiales bacterium]
MIAKIHDVLGWKMGVEMGRATNGWRRDITGLLVVLALLSSSCKQSTEDAKSSARESIAQALKQTSKALASTTRGDRTVSLSFCLINYNGDDALDVVGMTAKTESGPAVILDGRTGATLWSAGDYRLGAQVICPSLDVFILNDKDSWDLSIRSASNPDAEQIVRLSDKPEFYGFGSECLAVKTADKQLHGIRLKDVARVSCVAPVRTPYHIMRDIPALYVARDSWRARTARSEYEIAFRRVGSAVITAKSSGEFAWVKELPYEAPALGTAGLLTEDLLLLSGKRVSSTDARVLVIGLDRRTGAVRYEVPLCKSYNVIGLQSNGPMVLALEGWSGLWALDLPTGRVVWRSGECQPP